MPNLGVGHKLHDRVGHTEPGTQYRHQADPLLESLGGAVRERRRHGIGLDRQIGARFPEQQLSDFAHQPAEGGGCRPLIAQLADAMQQQWMLTEVKWTSGTSSGESNSTLAIDKYQLAISN